MEHKVTLESDGNGVWFGKCSCEASVDLQWTKPAVLMWAALHLAAVEVITVTE